MLVVSRPYANMIWGHSWGACVWNACGKRRILFVRMKRDDWREPDVKRRKRRKRNLVHRSASEEQLGPRLGRTSFHFEQWSRVETTLVQTTRIASRRRVTSASIALMIFIRCVRPRKGLGLTSVISPVNVSSSYYSFWQKWIQPRRQGLDRCLQTGWFVNSTRHLVPWSSSRHYSSNIFQCESRSLELFDLRI